jgi:hypothetical protein
MKLVFLHGAPAAGKLTVARALLEIVPGRLFDNHSAIDVARTVFDFGAPGFWELVQSVQCSVLEAATTQGVPMVVTTYCYADPDDLPAFRQFEAIVESPGGQLLPVFLRCSREEAGRRIGNPDRVARGKISTGQGLDRFLDQFDLTPVPRADCLNLDTDSSSPQTTAKMIARHFKLLNSCAG